jgi:hypothetical protein
VTIQTRAKGPSVGADVEVDSAECVIGEPVKPLRGDAPKSHVLGICAHQFAGAGTLSEVRSRQSRYPRLTGPMPALREGTQDLRTS